MPMLNERNAFRLSEFEFILNQYLVLPLFNCWANKAISFFVDKMVDNMPINICIIDHEWHESQGLLEKCT